MVHLLVLWNKVESVVPVLEIDPCNITDDSVNSMLAPTTPHEIGPTISDVKNNVPPEHDEICSKPPKYYVSSPISKILLHYEPDVWNKNIVKWLVQMPAIYRKRLARGHLCTAHAMKIVQTCDYLQVGKFFKQIQYCNKFLPWIFN